MSRNDLERIYVQKILYSSVVGSLMYAQVYTRLDIAFVVRVLGILEWSWNVALEDSKSRDALLEDNKRVHAHLS